MEVALLYFDGCPNHHNAEAQLRRVLDELAWGGSLVRINVDSIESAEKLRFRGSPTIHINGVDPFADPDAPVGLTCRLYPTGVGYQATPPVDELRAALWDAMER
jgi:hypothetical protein